MTSVIVACCQALEQGVSCDFSDPFYVKDVYNPAYYNGPAISETILAAFFVFICGIAVFNLVKLFKQGRVTNIKVTFLMNVLVFAFSLLWFVYALDGPIQLFSSSFGFSPNTVAVFQIYAICVLHLALLFSSYTWLNLILLYRQRSKQLVTIVRLCFALDLLYVCVILFMSIIYEPIDMDQGVTTSFITLSISALINGLVFSGSCFLLAGNLKEIYFFDREQQSKIYLLRIYAVIIGFLSVVRSLNDFLSFIISDWQAKWKVESYCNQEPGWALYVFFYSFFTDMLPTLLLLIIFSPAIRQKAEESFMRSYSSHLEDMEDYEESNKHRSLLNYTDYNKF